MRQLSIVRHAHAEREANDLPDFERNLDKRGRREAKHLAAHLAKLNWQVDHLLTSPAVRTVETAKTIAQAIGFPLEKIRHDDRLYQAQADALLSILRSAPHACRHVLLVGHNPGLSVLACRLDASHEPVDLSPSSLYVLRFAARDWKSLSWGSAERLRHDTARDLE